MYAANELSHAVRTRRTEIGLSQATLAKLAGLSRATVSQVESGHIKDLSLTRTAAMLNVLGLGLTITPAHPRLKVKEVHQSEPLDLAARTASTSYASVLSPERLAEALRSGQMPSGFEPHIAALLDEAPVALLARTVEQVHADSALPRGNVWANMRALAKQLMSTRNLWNAES